MDKFIGKILLMTGFMVAFGIAILYSYVFFIPWLFCLLCLLLTARKEFNRQDKEINELSKNPGVIV